MLTLQTSMVSQNQHYQLESMAVLQNWCQQANGKRFFLMRKDLLSITSKRLHAGAFQTPKSNAFSVPMRSFACDPLLMNVVLEHSMGQSDMGSSSCVNK